MVGSADNIGQRMAKGAAWSILSRLCVRGLGLISTLILARILIPDDFGLVVIAATCLGVLEVMGEFGLDTVLIAKQDSDRKLYNTAWTLQVLRGLILGIVLFTGSEYLASFLNEPRLTDILRFLALGAVIQGFINIGIVEFRKELVLQKEMQFQVTQKLCSFFVTLSLAYYWRDYWALVAGLLTGHFMGLVLSYAMSSYRPAFDLSEWRSVFHFSKWLVFINLLNYASSRGDTLIIGSKVGAQSVGYYSVANEIANLPTNELIFPIQRAVFPGFAKISKDKEALKNTYLSVFTLVVMFAAPIGIGISLVAEPMIPIVLGEKWIFTIPLIEILAISGAIRVMGASAGSVMYALSQVRIVAFIGCINTAARLILLFWWVSIAGAKGAAWAILATTVLSLCINLSVLSKILDLPILYGIRSLWRTICSLLAMVVAVTLVRELSNFDNSYLDLLLNLLVSIVVGALSYIAAHTGLWITSGRPSGPESKVIDTIKRRGF